jgi:hypothetical protein
MEAGDAWAQEGVAFYRGLGFFQTNGAASDVEIAACVSKQIAEWQRQGRHSLAEPQLAAADAGRSQRQAELALLESAAGGFDCADLERGVARGKDVYVAALQELAKMSRGSLVPEEVREAWESETGRVHLSFAEKGVRREIQPDYLDEWMDWRFFVAVDSLLHEKGYRLLCDDRELPCVLFILTEDEKHVIEHARGLKLYYVDEPWPPNALP